MDIMKESGVVHTTPEGGKQTLIHTIPTELPPLAVLEISRILGEGAAKYGSKNWHKIPVASELDHAVSHFFRFQRLRELAELDPRASVGADELTEELGHFATRALMALDQWLRSEVGNYFSKPQEGQYER